MDEIAEEFRLDNEDMLEEYLNTLDYFCSGSNIQSPTNQTQANALKRGSSKVMPINGLNRLIVDNAEPPMESKHRSSIKISKKSFVIKNGFRDSTEKTKESEPPGSRDELGKDAPSRDEAIVLSPTHSHQESQDRQQERGDRSSLQVNFLKTEDPAIQPSSGNEAAPKIRARRDRLATFVQQKSLKSSLPL